MGFQERQSLFGMWTGLHRITPATFHTVASAPQLPLFLCSGTDGCAESKHFAAESNVTTP
eukprot:1394172-Pyramimonas_sp.AAC.1